MARESITYERVAAAADALVAEGAKRPGVRDVRARVGGTTGLVGAHLRAWNPQRPAASAAAPIPLSAQLISATGEEIGRAVAAARAEVGADMAAAQEELTDLQSESAQQREEADAQTKNCRLY